MKTPKEHFKEIEDKKLCGINRAWLCMGLNLFNQGEVSNGMNYILNELLEVHYSNPKQMAEAVIFCKKAYKPSFKKLFGCIYIKRKEN